MARQDSEKTSAAALHHKRLEKIRTDLESRGITEQDVLDAVAWARFGNRSAKIRGEGDFYESEEFELPEDWFEYSLADGVDEGKPGIYQWMIEGVGSYIGKYSHIDRPTKQYGRNVQRRINLKPYRKSNEQGFRRIHEALAEAVNSSLKIHLRILENVEPNELNAREQALIRELRPELNG
jgi:hypothetical protein